MSGHPLTRHFSSINIPHIVEDMDMKKNFKRFLLTSMFLFLVACSESNDTYNVNTSYQILYNNSSISTYTNDRFALNLSLTHDKQIEFIEEEIEKINLYPHTNIVKLESFQINNDPSTNDVARKGLSLYMEAIFKGQHVYEQLELVTSNGNIMVDLGRIEVSVLDGSSSDLVSLMYGGGIFSQVRPFEFQLMNVSDEDTFVIETLIINPPYLYWDMEDIIILKDNKSVPLSRDHGYALNPGETIHIRLNWKIRLPIQKKDGFNIELRPILQVRKNEEVQFESLHSMVFRQDPNSPALRPQAASG